MCKEAWEAAVGEVKESRHNFGYYLWTLPQNAGLSQPCCTTVYYSLLSGCKLYVIESTS